MKSKNLFTIFIILIFAVCFYHCANIIPPSGGERDTKPPVIVKSIPNNESTNFTSKKIIIEFDEFFNLDNPLLNIVVSPPMAVNPEYTIVGKKLIIKLKDKLQDNITYNINFGESIKDFNEGNILKNVTYVFATGSILDTLQINGKVVSSTDNIAMEGVTIGVYNSFDDSIIYKSKPYYFAKSNIDGSYQIKNIHEGSYKIIALKDENLDYIYNNNEYIAIANSIYLNDTLPIKSCDFKLFKEADPYTKLIDIVNPEVGVVKFIFNKPIRNFKFDAALYNIKDIAITNPNKDTITYYYSSYETKNTIFYTIINDSIFDTIPKELFYIKDNEIEKNKIHFKNPTIAPINTRTNTNKLVSQNTGSTYDMFQKLMLDFNRPLISFNDNLIEFYEDSTLLNKNKYKLFIDSKDKTKLVVDYPLLSNTKYRLLIKESALTDLFTFSNFELTKTIVTSSIEDYGTIIINNNIINDYSYILQVFNSSNVLIYTQVLKKSDSSKKIILKNYPAGSYLIKVIEDLNNNKKWDTGNYLMKKQAEKIFTINNNLSLKAGWDAEVDIKF